MMTITTFRLQNIDRNGKFIKGQTFVSGTVVGWSNSHFTIEVVKHDDFHGTSNKSTYTIERKRIRSQSNVPIHPTDPDKKWNNN